MRSGYFIGRIKPLSPLFHSLPFRSVAGSPRPPGPCGLGGFFSSARPRELPFEQLFTRRGGPQRYSTAVTPSNYAAEELALWERALRDQREIERQVAAARKAKDMPEYYFLLDIEDQFRTRAALLLAKAVEKKLSFRKL